MSLPAHLMHFDSLVDILVDALVRQMEQGAEKKTPVERQGLAGVDVQSTEQIDERREHYTSSPPNAN